MMVKEKKKTQIKTWHKVLSSFQLWAFIDANAFPPFPNHDVYVSIPLSLLCFLPVSFLSKLILDLCCTVIYHSWTLRCNSSSLCASSSIFFVVIFFFFLLQPSAIRTYTHATHSVVRPCNSHIGRSKAPRSCFVENTAAFLHLLVASFVQAKRSRPSSQYRYMTLVVAATDASPIQRRHYNHFFSYWWVELASSA